MMLTGIYNERIAAPIVRLKPARWFKELKQFDPIRFRTVIDICKTHNNNIVNYFNNWLTNASEESFIAKIKDLKQPFRKINNTTFFLFRFNALYG